MTDGELRRRILDLADEIRVRRDQFIDLRESGLDAEADAARTDARPLCKEHHRLMALAMFRRTVPITWTHDVDEAAIEAAIGAPALVRAAREQHEGDRNIVLLGRSGVGKTATLALAGWRFYLAQPKNHFRALVWFYARDLAAVAAQYPLGRGEPPELDRASTAPLLVLDDLGQEREGDHGAILDVLDRRYRAERTTWISSGLTVDQLRARYSEAAYRRMCEVEGKAGLVVSCFANAAQRGHGEGTSPESAARP
ncbi:MAG TPA: hypothetical protein VH142_13215 [Polyangiaceae bacterium]|nr:hypothetical protein [Polyangiaceae bacterium]